MQLQPTVLADPRLCPPAGNLPGEEHPSFAQLEKDFAARRVLVGQVQTAEVEGGHHVHSDNPVGTARVLVDWLRDVLAQHHKSRL